MAHLNKLRHNGDTIYVNVPLIMTKADILISIQQAPNAIALKQLLDIYPNTARRTLQRWIRKMLVR